MSIIMSKFQKRSKWMTVMSRYFSTRAAWLANESKDSRITSPTSLVPIRTAGHTNEHNKVQITEGPYYAHEWL